MKVLVCGGAGYVGAHACKRLAEEGHEVVVLDNLSTGHREAVCWGALERADLRDATIVRDVLDRQRPDAVLHFAARSQVAESVREPYAYYRNNVTGSLNLLEAMHAVGVECLVFSSSAAVYGRPQRDFLDESHPEHPINPYGRTKLHVERMLGDAAEAYGLRSVSLRYFNAAGADPQGRIGESHEPETHLIPNVLDAVRSGRALTVFGDDYATPDGTCIRDYVHVDDLAGAHVAALDYLRGRPGAHRFNLGSETGYSVMQVLDAARRVTGREVPFEVGPRRPGDPERLVASSNSARQELGWKPSGSGIERIVETAWAWHCAPRF